ncbi:MAG: serine/threonine protein kinase [Proteobacteria bacterium]|nr:serine/threonine protein kinase [Pseudomonadota bacterium]
MYQQAETDPYVGTLFAERYLINFLVARGGMGNIYQVHDIQTGQIVALKLLRSEYNHDRIIVRRFERETDVVSKLKHPNICQLFDSGCTKEGVHYFTMEYLEGQALDNLLKDVHTLPPDRIIEYMIQAAAGLCDAHNHGIVHRDLKPANIFIIHASDDREYIKLLDFGIAKVENYEELNERLTNAGTTLGTPYYMSPEQIQGFEVDGRTDIYALGIILWEALFGAPPFVGKNLIETFKLTLKKKLPKLPLALRADPVWRKIYKVLQKALKKDRNKRYSSVQAFMRDLEAVRLLTANKNLPYNETPKFLPIVRLGKFIRKLPAHKNVLWGILAFLCITTLIFLIVFLPDWSGRIPANNQESMQTDFETYKFMADIPASVMLDGKMLGTTPLSVDLSQTPPFSVIVMAPDVTDFPIEIKTKSEGITSYAVNLKPKHTETPKIRIESIPPDAEVTIQGDHANTGSDVAPLKTPCTIDDPSLTKNQMLITLKLSGYKTENITVFSNGGDMLIKTNLFQQ